MSDSPRNQRQPTGVIFCAFFTFAAIACAGTYSGGSGTAEDPYRISTVADWQELIGTSGDWGKQFVLINDIDFGGINLMPVAKDTVPGNYRFDGTSFSGIFDGRRHVVQNAFILLPDLEYIGLFGCIGGGQILNLGVKNITVSGKNYVGGLCGIGYGGTIRGCYTASTVKGGGLWIGGLCGKIYSSTIVDCYATGTVTGMGHQSVGGLCGENSSGTISKCYATGAVTGIGTVGGLCGISYSGTISECYATGTVTGRSGIGGLCGHNDHNTIRDCYAKGAVTGEYVIGGLCGENRISAINRCYATGKVTALGRDYIGGLCGVNLEGWINGCFWDVESTGQTDSSGGKGLTSQQMRTTAIFQNAGWSGQGWVMADGQDTPHREWENRSGVAIPTAQTPGLPGSGTAEDPYRISTVEEFVQLSWHVSVLNSHIRLMADLDLHGVTLWPIGDLWPFTGVFDGNGCVLYNAALHKPGSDCVGLFGRIGSGGQVSNLGAVDCDMHGHTNVGILCGLNDLGTIRNCFVTGTVSGTCDYAGGLCGYNRYGTINDCDATATVTGIRYCIGGLSGGNVGTIEGCSAAGSVAGDRSVGGLCGVNARIISGSYAAVDVMGRLDQIGGFCGVNADTITGCYSTGSVSGPASPMIGGFCGRYDYGTIQDCFWDTQTSGQASSVGGIGKTTAEMQTFSTFASAGWDFNYSDGDFPDWKMPAKGYPKLFRQLRYSGGSGTAEDPYQLLTLSDWEEFSAVSQDWHKQFVLMNDLDLGGLDLNPIGTNPNAPFEGSFDGQGHTLRNPSMNRPSGDFVGLFGYVGTNGSIHSLRVDNSEMFGRYYVGGLAGYSKGNIFDCHTDGWVMSSRDSIGGLVGDNDHGTIVQSSAAGFVDGAGYVGGLVGDNNQGAIVRSHSAGTVNGIGIVGGLAGKNDGTITACFSSKSVTANALVGGLVGDHSYGLLESCYTTGPVLGNVIVGGLVGNQLRGVIGRCYSVGAVRGSDTTGGLVGNSFFGTSQDCFWDIQSSGQVLSAGGEGKTTAEMKTLATYTLAGWDFVGEAGNGTADVWRMCADGISYPRLSWEFARGGDMACPDGVGMDDVLYLAGRWMASIPATFGAADANADGRVDLLDFAVMAENWMK